MIAKMAGVRVDMPPTELLGRFTTPGKPEEILDWLDSQDFSDVIAMVASADMVAYGGLIQSRLNQTSLAAAQKRLDRLSAIRRKHSEALFFAYSAIMRLTPTATKAAAAWRLQLARYEETKDRYRRDPSKANRRQLMDLTARVPAAEIQRYEATRARNHQLQRTLLTLVKDKTLDYLILGQDDAQPYGPHILEQQYLRTLVQRDMTGGKVYLCEGIDQLGNVLISRALLRHFDWIPKVRVVFSDNAGMAKIANYESKIVALSLQDQLLASGASPALTGFDFDYTLYLNVPEPRTGELDQFIDALKEDVDQGFPVAVADINLGKDGTADPRLFAALWENTRIMKLLSFAGWNTAGNTMGTAIPAANAYLLSRRLQNDPLGREVAQREFLLHRFVNDYAYHKFTRPAAYQMIDAMPKASREETYGSDFDKVDAFVRQDLGGRLQDYFKDQFLGRRFFAGTSQYEVSGLDRVRIFLPWPRAFEVQLELRILTTPIDGNGKAQ